MPVRKVPGNRALIDWGVEGRAHLFKVEGQALADLIHPLFGVRPHALLLVDLLGACSQVEACAVARGGVKGGLSSVVWVSRFDEVGGSSEQQTPPAYS